MALRRIRSTWYVYYRDERGRLTTRSLHVHDADTARRLERRFMEQLRARKARAMIAREFPEFAPAVLPPVPEPPRRGGLRIVDMLSCAEGKRKLSKDHLSAWRYFSEWTAAHGYRYAADVTPQVALSYLEERYPGGNGKTFNNVRAALNTVFRCCLVEAHLQSSPFAVIVNRRVTEVETHRNLTLEEVERLTAALPLHLQIAVMLSRWTCQRLETVCRIVPKMFDFDRLVFVIKPGKTARFDKWVCVPIMPELERYIRPLLSGLEPDESIVWHYMGREYRPEYVGRLVNRTIRELRIHDTDEGKASFHSLRGTAITWFKEHGVRGDDLKSITGHASDEVEDIYARDIANLARIARDFRR